MSGPDDEASMVLLSVALAGAALEVCTENLDGQGIEPSLREGLLYLAFLLLAKKLGERWRESELKEFERVAAIAAPFLTVALMPPNKGSG